MIVTLLLSALAALASQPCSATNTSTTPTTRGRIPLYIGGIFPFSDTHPFLGSFPRTVLMAINHVNKMEGILDGYELRMRWNWTYVSTEQTVSNNM